MARDPEKRVLRKKKEISHPKMKSNDSSGFIEIAEEWSGRFTVVFGSFLRIISESEEDLLSKPVVFLCRRRL